MHLSDHNSILAIHMMLEYMTWNKESHNWSTLSTLLQKTCTLKKKKKKCYAFAQSLRWLMSYTRYGLKKIDFVF